MVDGALVISELHLDGATEDKTFAPGYGGPPPAELATLTTGARASFAAAGAERWAAVASSVDAMNAAWKRVAGSDVRELLAAQMTDALDGLGRAVDARDPARARQAALRVEQAALDLQLRHRPPAEVDLDRLDLWAGQLQLDAATKVEAGLAALRKAAAPRTSRRPPPPWLACGSRSRRQAPRRGGAAPGRGCPG
jgi:hypothetical protein